MARQGRGGEVRKSRFSEEQIIAVLKESEAGVETGELCRRHGITRACFYRWKSKFGGMEVSEARRLRALEEENGQLKHMVADQAVEIRAFMAAVAGNQGWSVDFMTDALSSGRWFRTLNIVDDYTRECLAIEVDTSLGGMRVVRVLEELKQRRGLPRQIRSDNGPEFVSRAVDQWAYEHGLQWHTIQPGRPMENGYVESFNGRFRYVSERTSST